MHWETLRAPQVRRLLDRLRGSLTRGTFTRVQRAAELLDSGTSRVRVPTLLAELFPGRDRQRAERALVRLVARVNREASDAGVSLRLQVSHGAGAAQGFVWFEGDSMAGSAHQTQELAGVGSRLIEGQRGRPLEVMAGADGRPVVRWFLSYSHRDRALKDHLFGLLQDYLTNSPKYAFEVWHDGLIAVGHDWREEIERALAEAHLGVLLVSQAFLASRFISDLELPAFVTRSGQVAPDRRVMPVLLRPVDFEHTDLKGLQRRQIFRDPEGKAFFEHRGYKRELWVAALVRDLHRRLDAPGDVLAYKPGGSADSAARTVAAGEPAASPAPIADAPSAGGLDEAPEERTLSRGGAAGARHDLRPRLGRELGGLAHLVQDARGKPTRLDPQWREARDLGPAGGVSVLGYLMDWVRDPAGPPLFALLGEYGMGKTISCQRLVHEIHSLRTAGDQALPEPLYFDLRNLASLRNRAGPPTLPEILQECINRGWPLDGADPAAQELIECAGRRPVLFVFDGLDEALVHLTEADGQVFTRELLRLRPMRLAHEAAAAGPGTRILISCRNHYFRTLQAQSNHFTAQERDATHAADYRALRLLPFSDDQIRDYFRQAVPGLDLPRVLERVGSVNSLAALCGRPFLLKLAAEYVPGIERARTEGRPVYAVTLYRAMVDRWLHRDEGKHHLKADHKQRLMAHLAAWMWRCGQRVVPVSELESWFNVWLRDLPDVHARYQGLSRDKLEEDLRTATFLVREDGGAAGGSGFRFAHSAFQEFFIARYLLDAIRDDQRAAWALPRVNEETLDFLGQLLAEAGNDELLQTLGRWRAPYLRQASELLVRYTLQALSAGWPAPVLAGLDMRGAQLQGMRFAGAGEPLNLSRSDFRDANLRDTCWQRVRLDGARFDGALLQRAAWVQVRAPGASFVRSECTGACFRRCRWPGSDWAGARIERARLLWTPAPQGETEGTPRCAPADAAEQARYRESRVRCVLGASFGHVRGVTACAFSPDGTRVVSGGFDNVLKLWDVATGECLATWLGHADWIHACAFSPDGSRVVSASHDGSLRLWDAATGACLSTWHAEGAPVAGCAFSPDGLWVVSAGFDNGLKLWDAGSGACLSIWAGHSSWVHACAFSPDGSRVVSASNDHTLKLWDVGSGVCLSTWAGHEAPVVACAFSPDGLSVVSASYDHTLKLWDAGSGECLSTWAGHQRIVSACEFSPDGTRVVSAGSDSALKLWDALSGECLSTWSGHADVLRGCAFSPDGARVISASHDNALKLWDVERGACQATWTGHRAPLMACAFAPDGTRIVSVGEASLRMWDAATGVCLGAWRGHDGRLRGCAFAPNGARVVSAGDDHTLKVWDAMTGECLATWEGHQGGVNACAFSPDGTWVVSVDDEDMLKVWAAATGECLATWQGDNDMLRGCAVSPCGSRVVLASDDHTLKVWEVATGECLTTWTGHHASVTACAFSPDGLSLVSAGFDRCLKLWDPASGECLSTWTGHEGRVAACVFSPDGSRVVSAGFDNALKLWDVATGECLATWVGHRGPVHACAFSPDGRTVASAGVDGALMLWEVASGTRRWIGQTEQDEHAVWDPRDGRIIEASEHAWRFLRWQVVDGRGRLEDILPAETFGPLPAPRAGIRGR